MAFKRAIGIDWSGAKGARHPGIAVAEANENGWVRPVSPVTGTTHWSRLAVLDYIEELPSGTAVAMDSSFSLPFLDKGFFLPGLTAVDGPALWAEVDGICANDKDLFGGTFVETYADFYQLTKPAGSRFERRYRTTEAWANKAFKERCECCFHLIGASQIGKGGLATMRLLHQLKQRRPDLAVWPFDDFNPGGVTIFEAFATTWRDGHRSKITDLQILQAFLNRYGVKADLDAYVGLTDDQADAALMAAGLRSLFINGNSGPYLPNEASVDVLKTEGWIITGEPSCI